MKFGLGFGVSLLFIGGLAQANLRQSVHLQIPVSFPAIYGADDRADYYQIQNLVHRKITESTVALFHSEDVTPKDSKTFNLRAQTLTQAGVCSSEKYSDQPSLSYCSGTMIGNNLILSAGHCITSASICKKTRIAFGYAVKSPGIYPVTLPASEVYGCKSIVHLQHYTAGADFEIIETDRPIQNHIALKLSKRTRSIPDGTKVMVVGYPMGLPMKADETGVVRNGQTNGFFSATFDTFRGNSGSGVFNLNTGEIEGVFVRGEHDFNFINGCNVYNHCPQDGCRGEDVTKASSILPFLP